MTRRSEQLRLPLLAVLILALAGLAPACNNLNSNCLSADPYCDPLAGLFLYTGESGAEHLYFIRASTPRAVYRYNIASGSVENLGGTFSSSPASMAVDSQNGFLYYSVDSNTTMRRARLDGSENVAFVTDISGGNPIGLQIDNDRDRFYWWNTSNELRYVNLDGSGTAIPVRAYGANILTGAYDADENLWYVAGGPEVRTMPDSGASDTQIDNASTNLIDLDLLNDTQLVVTDLAASELVRMNRDGSNRLVLRSVFGGGTAYDAVTGTLYNCNQDDDVIEIVDVQTGARTILSQFESSFNPVACALQFPEPDSGF